MQFQQSQIWLALMSATVQAQAPSSRKILFSNVNTTITYAPDPSPCQRNVILRMFSAATGGTQAGIDETQTVSLDDSAGDAISFVLGSTRPTGVDPNDFQAGSSLFLDVLNATTLTSVLPARIELTAVAFAVNPGPKGDKGDKGDPELPGPVQSVSAGDPSIAIGGTPAVPTVSVATNGITNAKVADGALSPAKVTGTAATLGSNNFIGNQNVSDGTVTVSSSNGVALDGIGSIVGVRGSAGAGGFGIVGSAPANGTAGQFNGSVNVTANLTTANDVFVGNVTNPAFAGSRSTYFQNNGGDARNSFRINAGAAGGSDNLFLVGYSAPPSLRGAGIKFLMAPAGAGQAERMTIDPDGNVGIGTASLGAKLDVAGDVSVRGLLRFGTHYLESATVTIAPGFAGTAVARCSAGEVVLSGGFITSGGRLLEAAWTTGRDGWELLAGNDTSANITIKATAVCARMPLPDTILP